MSGPAVSGIALPGMRPLVPSSGAGEDPARVRELAHQFESLFIAQMLRQMRQSLVMMSDEEQEEGAKTFGAMTDTVDGELARKLSEAGGMGIADVIIDAFERQRQAAAPVPERDALRPLAPPAAAPVPLSRPPIAIQQDLRPQSAGPGASMPLPAGQTVTSAFGWRPDPFTGESRFHKGVDVRAAYGQEVPAVAKGQVVSAGPEGGYGLAVLIEHGSGIRTRYAHLSELAVKAGDVVERGQDVGRVGQTGRSTGPHLHFELLADGRPVDPVQAAARFKVLGELKEVETVADSVNGRPSTGSAAEE